MAENLQTDWLTIFGTKIVYFNMRCLAEDMHRIILVNIEGMIESFFVFNNSPSICLLSLRQANLNGKIASKRRPCKRL
jgi:hypothetical protein